MIEIHDLRVPAEYPVMPRVPVDAGTNIPRLTVIAVDVRACHISLESPGNDHGRGLQLEAAIPHVGDDLGTRTLETIELAHVELALEGVALVLDAAIERGHLVAHLIDQDVRSKDVGSEDDRAVR